MVFPTGKSGEGTEEKRNRERRFGKMGTKLKQCYFSRTNDPLKVLDAAEEAAAMEDPTAEETALLKDVDATFRMNINPNDDPFMLAVKLGMWLNQKRKEDANG